MSRCVKAVWLLGSLTFLALSGQLHAASNDSNANIADYKIKAVYVYRFASFIYWPGQPHQTIHYCTLGNDKVIATLHELIGKNNTAATTTTTTTRIKSLNNISDASDRCQILYIGKDKLKRLSRIPQYQGTLTVSDSPQFLPQGGMIELRTVGNKVKPAISLDNVNKGELTISSLLLRISLLPNVGKGGNNE